MEGEQVPTPQKPRWPWVAGMAGVLVVFTGLGWAFSEPLLTFYHERRADMYNRAAVRFMSDGDLASAQLQVQNSIRHSPKRPETWSLAATLLKGKNDPDYVVYLAQSYSLDPTKEDVAVSLLEGCAQKRRFDLANGFAPDILKRFPNSAKVWHLHGVLQLGQKRTQDGYAALLKARDLDPANERIKLALGTLELASTDPAAQARGRATLEDLRKANPEFFASATQSLAEATSLVDAPRAIGYWDELIAVAPDNWTYRLRRADLIHRARPESEPIELEALWQRARGTGQRLEVLARVADWRGAADARRFMERLPRDERMNGDVRLFEISLLSRESRWQEIVAIANEDTKRKGNTTSQVLNFWLWQARAQRTLGNESVSRLAIRNALQTSTPEPRLALQAGDLMLNWSVPDDAALFYEIASQGPRDIKLEAWSKLAILYQNQRRTSHVLQAYEELAKLIPPGTPQSRGVRNNIAALLLILGRDYPRALKLSEELYAADPANPLIADTYARALALNADTRKALEIYATLPAASLQQPAIRLHYADTLRLAGRNRDARNEVASLDPTTFLPEEQQLLALIRNLEG